MSTVPANAAELPHISIVICGHVDSGKSTTTGRLLFELGGIPPRKMEELQALADAAGKSSFGFAFFLDNQKEERARGVTISCATKDFYTSKWHITVIDAPGHRDFIKNMISGAAQADVCLLMIPADGNFTTAIQRGDHKAGQIQGQSRQHARLINLLAVNQLIVGINKMDTQTAGPYSKARYDEISAEVCDMLVKTGWKKDFVDNCVPILPLSGWIGDNLKEKSKNMDWWKGMEVQTLSKKKATICTLLEALDNYVELPARKPDAPLRVPISGIYTIKGVGPVLTGRVEQGIVKPNNEVVFVPTHTDSTPCTGKVFTVEMHKKKIDQGGTGDNIGMNIKGLEKNNMPHAGDVMILKSDTSLRVVKSFVVQVQTLEIPSEVKVGYSPIAYVRCGHSACRIDKIRWKIGKETGRKKAEDPHSLKSNEGAELECTPLNNLVVEPFTSCEGLSRVAFLDGCQAVMLGKVISVVWK